MPYGNDPPVGLYTGLRAMTVQSYTEANVKNGAQYEFSSPRTTLASSGASSVTTSVLRTGLLPVLIKSRVIQYTGKGITARLYEGGTFTVGSGTALPIYNMRRKAPVPATGCTTRSGVTVTALGTECGAPTVGIGSTGNGQNVTGAFQVQGVERWLEPNTTYFLQITNDSTTDPTDISVYVTYYEGLPDLPLPQ